MWYFTWVLGTGFAACFAIINAIWYDIRDDHNQHRAECQNKCHNHQ